MSQVPPFPPEGGAHKANAYVKAILFCLIDGVRAKPNKQQIGSEKLYALFAVFQRQQSQHSQRALKRSIELPQLLCTRLAAAAESLFHGNDTAAYQ